MNLVEKDKAYIWHPYTQMQTAADPIPIKSAEGANLYTEDGKTIIDAVSSWWVNTHGHSHPHIAKKVYEQFQTLEHVIFAGFTHPKAVELAERLLKKLPDNQNRIFYSDNGSTAVEVALKMVFQYWHNQGKEKRTIIAFKEAFHGDTFGAMAVSGKSAFTEPFTPFLFDVVHIDPPLPGKEEECKKQFLAAIKTHNVAGFIFEPLVMGAAGMKMYEPEILDYLIKLAKSHEILTIADEIFTGFGRTGKFFATDHLPSDPDIFCLSKGLTGGSMAMGATSCNEKIYRGFLSDDASKTFFHGHSFTGNPITCAASCASLDLFDDPSTWENIASIIKQHKNFLESIKAHPGVRTTRQTGTIAAIELETGGNTSYFNEIRNKAYDYFIEKGVLLRPLGNVIYILPPYCISESDLHKTYNVVNAFLNEVS